MWFTCVFVIYGVAMVLTGIVIIAEAIEKKAEAIRKEVQKDALKSMFNTGNEELMGAALEQSMKDHKGTDHKMTTWKRINAWLETHPLSKSVLILFVIMFIGQIFMSYGARFSTEFCTQGCYWSPRLLGVKLACV
jgi:hypothetical protein